MKWVVLASLVFDEPDLKSNKQPTNQPTILYVVPSVTSGQLGTIGDIAHVAVQFITDTCVRMAEAKSLCRFSSLTPQTCFKLRCFLSKKTEEFTSAEGPPLRR